MKKSLISVAVMSLMASPLVIKSVQAQSNVTIYGTVDAGMRVQNHAGKGLGAGDIGALANIHKRGLGLRASAVISDGHANANGL